VYSVETILRSSDLGCVMSKVFNNYALSSAMYSKETVATIESDGFEEEEDGLAQIQFI